MQDEKCEVLTVVVLRQDITGEEETNQTKPRKSSHFLSFILGVVREVFLLVFIVIVCAVTKLQVTAQPGPDTY